MSMPDLEFREAMRHKGLEPPAEIVADGGLHRFNVASDKSNRQSGWYVFHSDPPAAGAFGCWKTAINEKWCAGNGLEYDPQNQRELLARYEKMRKLREKEKQKRHREAREKASRIWENSDSNACDHAYLQDKGVKAHGVRSYKDKIVLTLRDTKQRLQGLQFISEDGSKRFLSGTKKRGGYYAIGTPKGVLVIAEGYATAASIHEATEHAVAVAFDAGNLLHVAKKLRQKMPDVKILVCADNDKVGIEKARLAAEAVGGFLAIPTFDNPGNSLTDFNDLVATEGIAVVREQIKKALTSSNTPAKLRNVDGDPDDWCEPGLIEAELLPVMQFDVTAMLPETLAGWVEDEADRMPCPVDYVAITAIALLGSVIGASCSIRPKRQDTWQVVPNLWSVAVGAPSSKKSPAMKVALAPLDRIITKLRKRHQEELEEYEVLKLADTAVAEAIESRLRAAAKDPEKGDPKKIAEELLSHKRQVRALPLQRRFLTNDPTVEKVGEILEENLLGIAILRDELTGFLVTMDRNGRESDRAFFLESWNGTNSFQVDRIGRGSIFIENLCVSVIGGTQPDKLLGYLEQAAHTLSNDGLMQRFQLLTFPDHRRWEWRDRTPDRELREKVYVIFEQLSCFDPVVYGAAPEDDHHHLPQFSFDDEAQQIFIEWTTQLHREKIETDPQPLIAQHLAKYDKLFSTLSLIFHLVECASGAPGGPVRRESALRAAAWCEYLESHARRVYGLLADEGVRAAQSLAERIRTGRLSDGFTVRDIRRNQWRYLTEDDSIKAAIDWLIDEHWLRSERKGAGEKGGRPTVIYTINPVVKKEGKGAA